MAEKMTGDEIDAILADHWPYGLDTPLAGRLGPITKTYGLPGIVIEGHGFCVDTERLYAIWPCGQKNIWFKTESAAMHALLLMGKDA